MRGETLSGSMRGGCIDGKGREKVGRLRVTSCWRHEEMS